MIDSWREFRKKAVRAADLRDGAEEYLALVGEMDAFCERKRSFGMKVVRRKGRKRKPMVYMPCQGEAAEDRLGAMTAAEEVGHAHH